jgi:thioredoxin-like negative regulator of GroEL
MPEQKKLHRAQRWLKRLEEDRRDYALANEIVSRGEPTFSLEEVIEVLRTDERTQHGKPRKSKS